MNQTLDRTTLYLPWAGLFLIVAGLIVTAITRRFELANNLLLGGGALLLLLFAVARPGDVRQFVSGRHARYGTSTFLSILFFAAIAILLYWITYQNSDWRVDVTETDEFTPLPETRELLERLEEPVHVIGFFGLQSAQQRERARTILDTLAAVNDEITYEFQELDANPLLAQKYELNFEGTLVFIKNRGEPDEVFARANTLNDREIHAALLQIINPVEKNLYVVTGHGEPAIDDFNPQGIGTMVGLLEDQGFNVQELNLFTTGAVPEDATVIALIGPQTPLDPAEVDAIVSYLESGGSAFIARDVVDSENRAAAEEDGLNTYLADNWGITLRQDVVVDQDLARAGQTFGLEFLAADYGTGPIITDELRQFGTRFSLARSIATDEVAAVTQNELVRTSSNAWGETDLTELTQTGVAEPDPEDAQGVLAVGVSAEEAEAGARLVVFGDADFANNANLVWGGNSLLFTNALNWLANDEVDIELTPRETVQRQVNIPQTQLGLLQFVGIWFGPALMGVLGLIVWYGRRQRV